MTVSEMMDRANRRSMSLRVNLGSLAAQAVRQCPSPEEAFDFVRQRLPQCEGTLTETESAEVRMAIMEAATASGKSPYEWWLIDDGQRVGEITVDELRAFRSREAAREEAAQAMRLRIESFEDLPLKDLAESAGLSVEDLTRRARDGDLGGAYESDGTWYVSLRSLRDQYGNLRQAAQATA